MITLNTERYILFSCSVMSNSVIPWTAAGQAFLSFTISLEFAQSCPLSWWCHANISFAAAPFLPALVFPSSGSFSMNHFFASGGQSIGVPASTSASVLPMNIQGWFPLGLTSLISLLSKAFSRVFSNNTVWKHQFFCAQPSLWSNFHILTWLLENQSFVYRQSDISAF